MWYTSTAHTFIHSQDPANFLALRQLPALQDNFKLNLFEDFGLGMGTGMEGAATAGSSVTFRVGTRHSMRTVYHACEGQAAPGRGIQLQLQGAAVHSMVQ